MAVILRASDDALPAESYKFWYAVTGTLSDLDPKKRMPGVGQLLERAFEGNRENWWKIGKKLAATPGGDLAHAPTAAAFNSDFGQTLAWATVTEDTAKGKAIVLVVCDDPWLFRHLALLPGVRAGRPPALLRRELALGLRGFLSRLRVSARMFVAALTTRGQRKNLPKGGPVLLVYGHPKSNADGYDEYFGTMMRDIVELTRLVHTDCPPARARELSADGRTASLHAWGNPLFALSLVFTRWRAPENAAGETLRWLVRRAVARENGAGALAMTRWQIRCQQTWLAAMSPSSVAWSWENHPWERDFVGRARVSGTYTIGSQDTDVGPHQMNMACFSNSDGPASIPDVIICNGPAYRDELADWGVPEDRLVIGGSSRITRFEGSHYDLEGPVFVALSSIPAISQEMMVAVAAARNGVRQFLVKEHPMYPFAFPESGDVRRTGKTIPESPGISAVFFGTGLSGMEGLMSGVPTFRLLPSDRIGVNTMPVSWSAIPVTVDGLAAALDAAPVAPDIDWDAVFSPVDMEVWRSHLFHNAGAHK